MASQAKPSQAKPSQAKPSQAKPSLRAPCPATLARTIRTTPTCVKHQQTTEEIHGSKSRLPTTCTTTFLTQTTVMSTTHTTSTLETPTLTTCTETILIQTYYSDDEYSRDPDVDYADTTCYQPCTSTCSSYASGAFHPGISTQLWQCQPNSSSGKSLVKQDPQNRSYPRPRKAKKRHKMKHPKPTHLHHLSREPCAHRSRRLGNCPILCVCMRGEFSVCKMTPLSPHLT
jgi:hypothetical protein